MTVQARELELVGAPIPRVAPPIPARSLVKEFEATAIELGIRLYPWQLTAARYITAIGPDGGWLYPEVAIVVGRQNGKTELLKPLIVGRLRAGRRLMHAAQNRELPRETFGQVADIIEGGFDTLAQRGGRVLRPRFANGQEEIRLANGGLYRIVAGTRGGARGPSNDDVIIDELREMRTDEFIAAAEPTLMASGNGQIIYLSNAGDDESVVLNALRDRAEHDPSLAYLEWSAEPELDPVDRAGWIAANPSLGHKPGAWEYLERKYESYRLADQLHIFETEHLCRWVPTRTAPLVGAAEWAAGQRADLGPVQRPAMAVALDPGGTRASAVIAWPQGDGGYACDLILDETAEAIDVDDIGPRLQRLAITNRVRDQAFSSGTDVALSRFLPRARAVDGRVYANACASFANLVEGGLVRWRGAGLAEDFKHIVRMSHADGTLVGMRADGAPPTTAGYAAIRAVWLASAPRRIPRIG